MAIHRTTGVAAFFLVSLLLAGCSAQAATPATSRIALAGAGSKIVVSPVPPAAYVACAARIAADRAAKKAADAKAKAARALRAASALASTRGSGTRSAGSPYWYIDSGGLKRAKQWRCPYCGVLLPVGVPCPRGTGPLVRPLPTPTH